MVRVGPALHTKKRLYFVKDGECLRVFVHAKILC